MSICGYMQMHISIQTSATLLPKIPSPPPSKKSALIQESGKGIYQRGFVSGEGIVWSKSVV